MYTKGECNCFPVQDRFGNQVMHFCSLHKAAPDMYEALKAVDDYLSAPYPENMKLKQIAADKLVLALAKAGERCIKP